MKYKLVILFAFLSLSIAAQLPKGFVYVKDIIPSIKVELRYYGNHNFIGKRIDGYHNERAILSKQAALALKAVQKELASNNLSVLIYDSYRPQTAVNHFVRWAKDLNDTIQKQEFYPLVLKQHLFEEGYIASKSGHTRGSTLDITLVDLRNGEPLDMGSPYDFFGKESWVNNTNLSKDQLANRMLLQKIMAKHGFRNYANEWWHFTLKGEPFPNTYFDFPVN